MDHACWWWRSTKDLTALVTGLGRGTHRIVSQLTCANHLCNDLAKVHQGGSRRGWVGGWRALWRLSAVSRAAAPHPPRPRRPSEAWHEKATVAAQAGRARAP